MTGIGATWHLRMETPIGTIDSGYRFTETDGDVTGDTSADRWRAGRLPAPASPANGRASERTPAARAGRDLAIGPVAASMVTPAARAKRLHAGWRKPAWGNSLWREPGA